MRRLAAAVLACALAVGCTGGRSDPPAATSTLPASPSVDTPTPPEPGGSFPGPEDRIPRDADSLADELGSTWASLRAAIAMWKTEGDPAAWPPPEDVELLALHEQRIYRMLGRDERLADEVFDRLPHRIAVQARANVRARVALNAHLRPISGPITLLVRRPEPADVLLAYMQEAAGRFGVAWEVLAAVMLIETRMGRVVSRSSAGAQGPMQFLPATWEAYGLGGDVHDERDAIIGAANYLKASGAPEDHRLALYRYNPLRSYVNAVSAYAKVMEGDPDAFYAYYNWQVFVRTKDGDVRLSGPGLDGQR